MSFFILGYLYYSALQNRLPFVSPLRFLISDNLNCNCTYMKLMGFARGGTLFEPHARGTGARLTRG